MTNENLTFNQNGLKLNLNKCDNKSKSPNKNIKERNIKVKTNRSLENINQYLKFKMAKSYEEK